MCPSVRTAGLLGNAPKSQQSSAAGHWSHSGFGLPLFRYLPGVRFTCWLTSAWLVFVSCAASLSAAPAAHTRASLLLGVEQARPGDTILAGLKLNMDPRWHTYWKNPGGPGIPTKIEWQLPTGVTASELHWPLPEKLPDPEFTTYIYKDEVIFPFSLKLAADLKPGPVTLKGSVSWLECDVQCVPGNQDVEATLTVGTENKLTKNAELLANWEKKVPIQGNPISARATWGDTIGTNSRTLVLEWQTKQSVSDADFYPDASDNYEIDGATKRLPSETGTIRISTKLKKTEGDWPAQVAGVIVQKTGTNVSAWETNLPVGGGAAAATVASKSLWVMLLNAFIGGLILNFMPCVLPVIGLKILGFVGQGRDNPKQARLLGLIYAAGVIVSFLVVAAVVIALHSAGHKVGWGLQFTNPYFLVGMTLLATLIALNLFGVFEVHVGGRTMDAASKLTTKHGPAGAFFNGLLATVLASSCTAPFFGAAVGFAFAQPPLIILLVLATAGVGLAAPYVVLTWQPGWLRYLPKPGPWMERFKIAMGFPMLAAAVWLFSLAGLHYGERSLWLALFLVIIGLAAWVYGEFLQRNHARPGLALGLLACLLIGGYWFTLENRLRWRQPDSQENANTDAGLEHEPGGIKWQRWSRSAVASARAEGKPVLVDFTAKWCLTCNTIVKPALESDSVREKVQQLKAATFLANYTSGAPEITEELGRYDRAGVPLVLVFPKDPGAPVIVLPEALTPGMIVSALEKAAR